MTTLPAPRRTQAERRASTREALLQATIECLVDVGYAGTTTSEVQRRAGVSRGALTHHFASKAELLTAAMESLYDDLSAGVRDASARLPAGESALQTAVLVLWSRFDGPLFLATMELWGAARTDPGLRAALLPHELRLERELCDLVMKVIGRHRAERPAAAAICQVLMTSMRGQAMSYALWPEVSRQGPDLQHWFDLVETFV